MTGLRVKEFDQLVEDVLSLFERLDKAKQARLLQILFARIIIDTQGTILEFELNPPFMYLHQLVQDVGKTANSERKEGGSIGFHLSPPLANPARSN
jgi:hypothetical protein